MRRFLKALSIATLAALLAACGGGGGGGGNEQNAPPQVQGPPEVAGALANTNSDAAQAAKAIVTSADAAADNSKSMTGVFALFGAPTGLHSSPSAAHAHPLAVQTAACTDVLASPCSGSATLDSNLLPNATSAPAGTYFDITFASLSGMLGSDSVTLNGRMRIDFLATFDLANPQPTGLDLQILFDHLGGSLNGAVFGPETLSLRMQIDAQGHSSVIAGGMRYSDVGGVSVVDAANYSIAGSSVRASHWSNAGTYVDLNLSQWQVAGGRPTVGSTASVAAGSGSATVQVISSSSGSVVYTVVLTAGGSSTTYTVTATYPQGGGLPTYVAVPVGG